MFNRALDVIKEILVNMNPKAHPSYFEIEPAVFRKLHKNEWGIKRKYFIYKKQVEDINYLTFITINSAHIGQYSMFGLNIDWQFTLNDFLSDTNLQETELEKFLMKWFTKDDIIKIVEDIKNENYKSKILLKFAEKYFVVRRAYPQIHLRKMFSVYRATIDR